MANTYKVCTGATAAALETAVQECVDLNYGIIGDVSVTSVIDSADNITYLYVQAVKLKNS